MAATQLRTGASVSLLKHSFLYMSLPHVTIIILKTDNVLLLGVPTVRDANNAKGGCDTGTD